MTLIVININKSKLPQHTKEEFKEWIMFEVGHEGAMSTKNPLSDEQLKSNIFSIGE